MCNNYFLQKIKLMTELKIEVLENLFAINKENSLKGKWITFNTIKQLLDKHGVAFKKTKIGTSEENRPIYSFKIGTGSKKILLWSQMHGNESTGTKAMFDLFNTFSSTTKELQNILNTCTLIFIPMLNPDGAEVFTRVNANNIDLNRDAVDKKAKESQIFKTGIR
jgi:Predicted carboxypeptidase